MSTILRHPPWLEVADLARSGRDSPGSQGAGLGAGAGFSKTKLLSRAVLSSLGLTLGRRAFWVHHVFPNVNAALSHSVYSQRKQSIIPMERSNHAKASDALYTIHQGSSYPHTCICNQKKLPSSDFDFILIICPIRPMQVWYLFLVSACMEFCSKIHPQNNDNVNKD